MVKPKIISVSVLDREVVLNLHIDSTLVYFQGHFPSAPVLPGVVQIGWAIELGTKYFNINKKFSRMDAIKFSKIIQPDLRVVLRLTYESERGRLGFSYENGGQRFSSGRILFIPSP